LEEQIFLTADGFPLVRDIGWNQALGLYTHPDRRLDYEVFIYVTQGSMQVIEEGTEYVVQAGEYLFLRGGLHHWGEPRCAAGTSWYWVHFTFAEEHRDKSSYKDYIPLPELGYYYPDYYQYRFPLPKYGRAPVQLALESRLRLILEQVQQTESQSHWMTRSCLSVYELFMDIHAAGQQESSTSVSGKNGSTVRRVTAYLIKHCGEEFAGEQLASQLNMNYSYLSAAFKQATGQTIIETHTKLRMNKAIELMRTSSFNVSEISEALGYPNPYYFSRVFKKVLGESPSSYMKHLYRT
jgi:AraC-like DNA-binding protein